MGDTSQVRLEPEHPDGGDCRWRWTYDDDVSEWYVTRDDAHDAAAEVHPGKGIG